jgi:cytochrome c oxidase cbb3-type subunit 3
MDDKWVYGAEPDTVFETIVKGRPNGMPSFAGKIPDAQVWQIVAYVRSMSGQLSSNTSPARTEDMGLGSSENSRPRKKPIKITPPPDVLPSAGTFTFASGKPTTATAPTTAPGGKP